MTNEDLKIDGKRTEPPVEETSDKSAASSGRGWMDIGSDAVDSEANLVSLFGTVKEAPDLSKQSSNDTGLI